MANRDLIPDDVLQPLRVRAYVDGLNFYFGVARSYGIKWINIEPLLEHVIATDLNMKVVIEKTTVFTSLLLDPQEGQNLTLYYSALEKLSRNTEVKFGEIQDKVKSFPLADHSGNARVIAKEEKETDVRLGCEVINDACVSHGTDFDVACVVSDDRDMKAVFDIMLSQGKIVLWLSPRRIINLKQRPNYGVNKYLHTAIPQDIQVTTPITRDMVARSQLPVRAGAEHPQGEGWAIAPC